MASSSELLPGHSTSFRSSPIDVAQTRLVFGGISPRNADRHTFSNKGNAGVLLRLKAEKNMHTVCTASEVIRSPLETIGWRGEAGVENGYKSLGGQQLRLRTRHKS